MAQWHAAKNDGANPFSSAEYAMLYISRGWSVIPVPKNSKAPNIRSWQELKISADQIPQYFQVGGNVGLLLGKPSHGLVDIDLDCSEALILAPHFLPRTNSRFGYNARPESHWLYVCDGVVTKKYAEGGTLVELRSTGTQTVAP
jgi:hypothetical protein